MSGPPRRDSARSVRGGPAGRFAPGLAAPVDPLTGLFTRDALETVIRRRAKGRRRSTPAEDAMPTLTGVLIDLIGLKEINALEGFSAGDGLLRTAAGRLTQIAPDARLLARLGGDELVALFTGPQAALRAARTTAAAIGDRERPRLRAAWLAVHRGDEPARFFDRLHAAARGIS